MKTIHWTAVSAAVFSVGTLVPNRAEAQSTIPSVPIGSLTAFPTVVQTGTKPTLRWNILYPSKVGDVVEVSPPGTLTPNQTTYASVQVVGTQIPPCEPCSTVVSVATPGEIWQRIGDAYQQLLSDTRMDADPFRGLSPGYFYNLKRFYTEITDFPALASTSRYLGNQSLSAFNNSSSSNPYGLMLIATGGGTPPPTTMPPTDARLSLNGGAYQQLFYGTQADVDPAKKIYIKKLLKNQTLDFGGRYVKDGAWSPFYTTRSTNMQVIALVRGDYPPTNFSLYRQAFLASYLKPYLDSTGRVNIGPLSVLIVMELDNSNHALGCFDYQDMVLLVTFSSKHPNNGHGNNLDGVDSSNPGNGHGGPNGMVDPSGGVDDEAR